MKHIFRCARATWSVCRPFCSITTKKDAVSDCINKDSQYQNSKLVVNIFSQIGSQYLAHIFCQYLIFLLFNCWWLPLQKNINACFLLFLLFSPCLTVIISPCGRRHVTPGLQIDTLEYVDNATMYNVDVFLWILKYFGCAFVFVYLFSL